MRQRITPRFAACCLALVMLAVLAGLSFALPCAASPAAATLEEPPKAHVLFLASYSYEWESMPPQIAGITDTLGDRAKVDYVFMDTKRQPYRAVTDNTYRQIRRNTEMVPYDYVIACDDAALLFANEYRIRLFRGTPIIFEGINDEDFAHHSARDPLITGIVETFPLQETIRLAAALNPDAVRVVGVVDDTLSGQGSADQFWNCQSDFPSLKFSTIDCSFLTREEIAQAVASCGPDTILVHLMLTADADGNNYTNTEAVEFVAAHAKVPLYKADELGIGQGLLGGVVVSYYDMAADAAAIVLALQEGGAVSSFPVQDAASYCTFDKAKMDEFGITKAALAAAYTGEIRYVNDPPTYFEEHKIVLIPAGAVISLLILFSAISIHALRRNKSLLRQLQERDRMLNSVLDSMPGGVVSYRIRGDTPEELEPIFYSKGIPRLSGRTPEEFLSWSRGDALAHCVLPEDAVRLRAALCKSIPLRAPISVQFHQINKDGSISPVALSAVWGRDERDGSCVYNAVYLDMTQQEKARLAEGEAMAAKASNEAKSEFLSRMSHDIRTPLNAVLGFAVLAQDEPGIPAAAADYLGKINSSGKYLLGLINDILDMSKIESGKVALHPESTDHLRFLRDIADVFGAQAADQGIALTTDFSGAACRWVMLDPLRTRQIYANLLSNAIKFSTSGTEIRWTVRDTLTDAGTLRMVCTIQDHGRGMSPEFMSKMFLPFEQDNVSAPQNGTGLGLPIVKNLVDLMGGQITAESEPGRGTTFTLVLDRQLGTPCPQPAPVVRDYAATLHGRRILLCEDNHINVVVASKLLGKVGCTVETAENGQLCLERFSAEPPGWFDAVLMDIQMPVMNGLEAARRLRALPRPDAACIPILAMSANAFAEDVRKSLAAGMNAHLSKPIEPETLYRTLAEKLQDAGAL